MKSWLLHTSRGWAEQGLGHPGSPRNRSPDPMLLEVAEKRSRSTLEVRSAHPSATSPEATDCPKATLTSLMLGLKSGCAALAARVEMPCHIRKGSNKIPYRRFFCII